MLGGSLCRLIPSTNSKTLKLVCRLTEDYPPLYRLGKDEAVNIYFI